MPTSVSGCGSKLDVGDEGDFFEGEPLFGRVRSIADVDRNIFGEVYIPEWNVPCGSRLETAADCREMVDGFAPPRFFSEIREMDDKDFFDEFNYLIARQTSFCAESRARAERNIALKRKYISRYRRLAGQFKEKDAEIKALKTQVSGLSTEVSSLKSATNPFEADTSLTEENLKLKSELDLLKAELAVSRSPTVDHIVEHVAPPQRSIDFHSSWEGNGRDPAGLVAEVEELKRQLKWSTNRVRVFAFFIYSLLPPFAVSFLSLSSSFFIGSFTLGYP